MDALFYRTSIHKHARSLWMYAINKVSVFSSMR